MQSATTPHTSSAVVCLQMGSFFVEQGSQMDRVVHIPRVHVAGRLLGGGGFRIPAASLALFNTISIIVLIPVYDKGLVPLLRKFGRQLTLLQRIGMHTSYYQLVHIPSCQRLPPNNASIVP